MNKSEKKVIINKVKESIKHIGLLSDDIQKHNKEVGKFMSDIYDMYVKEGKQKAVSLIPSFRESIYNNTLKTLDVENLNTALNQLISLANSFEIDLELNKSEQESVEFICSQNTLNTVIDSSNKVHIKEESSLQNVISHTDSGFNNNDNEILEQIISKMNVRV